MQLSEKYQVCVNALREYADGAHFTEALVGLSGGIDSALTAAMSVDVFGAEHVHGVLMPGPFSSDHSITDALDLAQRLGIETQTISISEPFSSFENIMAQPCGGKLAGLAAENTQARCRMVILMALSNAYNWMLVNTGNKSEAAMGYSTLYGDTAGAFAPLGALYKTDVFALCRWLNETAQAEGRVAPIPENVITKPPSAELSPDQQDEKSMGVDYATLDEVLIAYCEQGATVDQLVNRGYARDLVEYIVRRFHGYAFKRALEPPFPAEKIY